MEDESGRGLTGLWSRLGTRRPSGAAAGEVSPPDPPALQAPAHGTKALRKFLATLSAQESPVLLDLGPDITPRAAITDKGYDAKANRDGARRRGICPLIPYKSNAVNRPVYFPKALYKARARIEQAVGKLKRFKRIALRCEKTACNFGSFVALALGFILIKSVHTT